MTIALRLDNCDLAEFTVIAANFGSESFGYAVTPNVDHLIRYHDDRSFRESYMHADHVLLDSRFLAYLLRMTKGVSLRVCTGSDLTAQLLAMAAPTDPIVLIGASAEQAQRLRSDYGLLNLSHYEPPMGFIREPQAVEDCLRFIEAHSPFRFCFMAVGSPQQEMLARELKVRGIARGLAMCVGGAINFLTGAEQRAPRWMQRIGLEWLFRLLQDPGRMAGRYLWRGPRIVTLLPKFHFELGRSKPSDDGI
jgi:exopolysaccharide biosynthesis WecB/TagA/CpsF family protein